MELSVIGEACLVVREGRRLTAYRDTAGVWTIGIGCTRMNGRPVRRGDTLAAAECDALFEVTVATYVAAVNRSLAVPVPQHAFDALVSVCYNIGIAGFAGSTFLRRINAGDLAGARDAILWWRIPAAIVTRRQAEAEQFVTPYAEALPRATVTQKPLAAPVVAPAPVSAPDRPWLARVGAWLDRALGSEGGHREAPDLAARG